VREVARKRHFESGQRGLQKGEKVTTFGKKVAVLLLFSQMGVSSAFYVQRRCAHK